MTEIIVLPAAPPCRRRVFVFPNNPLHLWHRSAHRPGFCRMSTTTGFVMILMFGLLCAGFVWKYGHKFKK